MSFVKLPVLRHGLMTRDPDILSDGVVKERIEKTRRLMRSKNVESLLLYSDPTRNGPVCYLTNYPCFGLGRRATAVLGRTEGPFLFTAEPSRNLPRVRVMTTCDLEKTRQFLSQGCERARTLAGDGIIGLAGTANLPAGLVKDMECLKERALRDVSDDFSVLMATKDEGSLGAAKRSLKLAETGMGLISEQAAAGHDLWQMAAAVDHRLRLEGCEDTNILLACSAGGPLRPGYPARVRPNSGDTLIAYIAVQYARHWGVAGGTRKIRAADDKFDGRLTVMREVRKSAASGIKAGMTLAQVEAVIAAAGRHAGVVFAEDVPIAAGMGFDLTEYPVNGGDRVEKDMILRVAMTSDFDGEGTVMLVNMLQVAEGSSVWLGGS